MTTQVPVSEGIFTWPAAEPHLIGSRCVNCGNYMFPTQSGCPKCAGSQTEVVKLSNRGTLWTWT
ncbi:MAG: zinc ribbon domain-containing protein, partial [Ilumatobacteraceae bacterium]